MVRLPTEATPDVHGLEQRTQLLHDLGVLISLWAELEMHVEIAIAHSTKMNFLHASIVLGTLQNKAKVGILYSLLKLNDDDVAVSKMKTAMSYAKRNALMHGMMGSEDDFSEFAFFHRSVDNGYKVNKLSFTAQSFHEHVWKFRELADEAIACLKTTPEQLQEYGRQAKFDGLTR